MQPIIRTGTRILRPWEYRVLRANLPPERQIWLDVLLYTGVRYIEAQRLQEHPEWLDGRFINLPKGSILKKRAQFNERTIRLSTLGQKRLPLFLKEGMKLPSRNSFDYIIKEAGERAGLGLASMNKLNAKTGRKTWESWLTISFPESGHQTLILLNQGHTKEVSIKHYLGLPFENTDKADMVPFVAGFV